MASVLFVDRTAAGRALADALLEEADGPPAPAAAAPLVLALPRGGLPVAYEVAAALSAPLDVLVVRKLGAPGQTELAVGAIASGGAEVLNEELLDALQLSSAQLEDVRQREFVELTRREALYRGSRPPPEVAGREIVVVDDGAATGATMRVAVAALKAGGAASVTVLLPVASREAVALLEGEADHVLCLSTPRPFRSVGQWYGRFKQVSDAEVTKVLQKASGAGGTEV